MTRCCAPVTDDHLKKPWYRHPDARCHREGHFRFHTGDKRFCFQHYRMWWTHYAIVERIRSFPDKVI